MATPILIVMPQLLPTLSKGIYNTGSTPSPILPIQVHVITELFMTQTGQQVSKCILLLIYLEIEKLHMGAWLRKGCHGIGTGVLKLTKVLLKHVQIKL